MSDNSYADRDGADLLLLCFFQMCPLLDSVAFLFSQLVCNWGGEQGNSSTTRFCSLLPGELTLCSPQSSCNLWRLLLKAPASTFPRALCPTLFLPSAGSVGEHCVELRGTKGSLKVCPCRGSWLPMRPDLSSFALEVIQSKESLGYCHCFSPLIPPSPTPTNQDLGFLAVIKFILTFHSMNLSPGSGQF